MPITLLPATDAVQTVSVCMPMRNPKGKFVYSLARLINHTNAVAPHLKLNFQHASGSLLHVNRNNLVNKALKSGADWTFWLDDDMTFPPDTLIRLLSHAKSIVGANYVTRELPCQPTAKMLTNGGSSLMTIANDLTVPLQEVDTLGFGCILVHSDVFHQVENPCFSMPWAPQLNCHLGEDVYFCRSASSKGFKVFSDTKLSAELEHTGDFQHTWDFYDIPETNEIAQPKLIPLDFSTNFTPLKTTINEW